MTTDVARLLARMTEQRLHWVDLGDGLRVSFLRPPEVELPRLVGGVSVDHVVQYAHGWSGFTEATLLGAAVGSSDPLPFDRELFGAWVRDHTTAIPPIAQAMADVITAHLTTREAVAKNSEPSST